MSNQQVLGDACEVINKAQQFFQNGCFVAGTQVHTKEGLVPIEKLKVGDYVLSKPESGEGEQSYQRVLKTFVHEAQPLLCVDIDYASEEAREEAKNTGIQLIVPEVAFPLIVTANHPFWVEEKGWINARMLEIGDLLVTADGNHHSVYEVSFIVRTAKDDIGWLMGGAWSCPLKFERDESRVVDLSNNTVSSDYDNKVENAGVDWCDQNDEDYLRRTVYNIEVENTHTYYVGEHGIWAHNPNSI